MYECALVHICVIINAETNNIWERMKEIKRAEGEGILLN
jgi:hypothetical protein